MQVDLAIIQNGMSLPGGWRQWNIDFYLLVNIHNAAKLDHCYTISRLQVIKRLFGAQSLAEAGLDIIIYPFFIYDYGLYKYTRT